MPDIRTLLHDHLFDEAPIMMAVLDKDYRVVQANASFAGVFGPWRGRRCYEVLKGRASPCDRCLAAWTFADGKVRVCDDRLQLNGDVTSHFVVRVAPLASEETGGEPLLIWIASNANEASSLLRENEVLFERAPCYITVLDRDLRIIRANRRMRETFGRAWGRRCYEVYKRRDRPCRECPALDVFRTGKDQTSTQVGVSAAGEETHYIVRASALSRDEGPGGDEIKYVIEMATDVTHLHILEKEKVEAERLAAVGQAVAGLAHGIKNILMGLEGGVYVMESGLKQNQTVKIERGMQMLDRNVQKISDLAKNLLSFSKGRVPEVAVTDPAGICREILELYGDLARQTGIELSLDLQAGDEPAPLDAAGIHSCLANLVSNAIDACQMSDNRPCSVVLRCFEKNGTLGFEVVDNGCGMDYEVKKKLFTTFFTTKGAGGTGLGLLTTRKIVQEHGGKITVDSKPGQGTTFRIVLPRERLPEPGGGEKASAGDGDSTGPANAKT